MMKRIIRISFILCVSFSLIACSLTQVMSGGEEDPPIAEYVPEEAVEPVEPVEPAAPEPTAPPEPTETPLPPIHWIAYESMGNIWVVDPDRNQYYDLTVYGTTTSGGFRYQNPHVSPNGLFVAFSSKDSFHIYSFETEETDQIRMSSPPEMLADMLLGWGEENMLYYTRTMGGCDLSVTPMKGPDSVDIMRYDPVAKSSEKIGEIPTIDEQSHAYSIGKSITPSGRYITAYNAACSVGFGSTFVYDVQTQAYERNQHGSAEISNDGSTLAYVDDSRLEADGYTTIIGVDRATQAQKIIYKPRISGYVTSDILWSPDDTYIAFLEWKIEDLANIRGMGGFFNQEALDDPYIVIVSVGPGDYNADITEMHTPEEKRHKMGAWAPDSRRFVYTQWQEGYDSYSAGALMFYDLNHFNVAFLERQEGLRFPDW